MSRSAASSSHRPGVSVTRVSARVHHRTPSWGSRNARSRCGQGRFVAAVRVTVRMSPASWSPSSPAGRSASVPAWRRRDPSPRRHAGRGRPPARSAAATRRRVPPPRRVGTPRSPSRDQAVPLRSRPARPGWRLRERRRRLTTYAASGSDQATRAARGARPAGPTCHGSRSQAPARSPKVEVSACAGPSASGAPGVAGGARRRPGGRRRPWREPCRRPGAAGPPGSCRSAAPPCDGRGGLEPQPADAREVQLRPGVRVGGPHRVDAPVVLCPGGSRWPSARGSPWRAPSSPWSMANWTQ